MRCRRPQRRVSWGDLPAFRVRDKIFVQYEDAHHGSGRVELWSKAPPGAQEVLVGSDPQRFFVPRYVGHAGWIGVRLDVSVGLGRHRRSGGKQLPYDRRRKDWPLCWTVS